VALQGQPICELAQRAAHQVGLSPLADVAPDGPTRLGSRARLLGNASIQEPPKPSVAVGSLVYAIRTSLAHARRCSRFPVRPMAPAMCWRSSRMKLSERPHRTTSESPLDRTHFIARHDVRAFGRRSSSIAVAMRQREQRRLRLELHCQQGASWGACSVSDVVPASRTPNGTPAALGRRASVALRLRLLFVPSGRLAGFTRDDRGQAEAALGALRRPRGSFAWIGAVRPSPLLFTNAGAARRSIGAARRLLLVRSGHVRFDLRYARFEAEATVPLPASRRDDPLRGTFPITLDRSSDRRAHTDAPQLWRRRDGSRSCTATGRAATRRRGAPDGSQ
jgi:hypothetical protein